MIGLGVVAVCVVCLWIVMANEKKQGALGGSAGGPIVSQGVAAIGADLWHEAGYDGTGVTVAVWDFGFRGYEALIGWELPPAERITTRGFGLPITGDPQDDPDGAAHGTAVAEIVHDVAPGAALYLVATDTDDDALEALEWLIDESVDIVVASISVEDYCIEAGASRYEPILERMRDAGILVVVASGNEGLSHWQGRFTDADEDDLHEYAPGDEGLEVELYRGDPIDAVLQWDDPCRASDNDFTLRLVDHRGRTVAENDYDNALDGPYEDLYADAPRDGTYTIEIERYSGDGDVLLDLVWSNGPEFEHAMREGSVSYFQPTVSPHVMTVGAVNWRTFDLESTSSGGPTKDGRIKPDLVAPTCVVSASYGGRLSDYIEYECGFEGTSAAAPHAAGAAALVKQAFPHFTAADIQTYLEQHAVDLGEPGKDNVYGSGRLQLPLPE
jgi:subtilisin family serine protease